MANRDKRTIASGLLQQLLAGELTNDDFQETFPVDASDPALGVIYERSWFFWDDRTAHRLTGKYALDVETRALFERCRAFLDSDLEYDWPARINVAPLGLMLLRVLRMRGAIERRQSREDARLRSIGDFDVWPFSRKQDLMAHLACASTPTHTPTARLS